jgi:GNAT superfamily N-acetyltransferase
VNPAQVATAPDVLPIERATLTAVPAPKLLFAGPFLARAFLGGTGRANAACSLDPSAVEGLEKPVVEVEAFYRRAGLACRFRSTPLDPPGLRELLLRRGYRELDESLVLLGPVSAFAAADPGTEPLGRPEADWMEVVATAEHQVPARRAEKVGQAELLGVPAAWMLLREGGRPAATAFVAVQGELAGLFDLAVRPEYRRRGLGQRVMAAAAAWAAGQGARWAYAQVASTNAASLALNARLGLRPRYGYRYLVQA